MPTFDIIVVGSGGGPDETNLSGYLFKPCGAPWKDGIIALEAGSGQGALSQILQQNPHLFASDDEQETYSAAEIYSFVRCYLITHAHLDHVNSLVISAGSLPGQRRRVYAPEETLRDLDSVFSGRIWPNLASWNEDDEDYKLLFTPLTTDCKYKAIFPQVSVRTMLVSHGCSESGDYNSAAFFIRHDPTSREFLFFGDVEPDSIAANPLTITVWRAAAPRIPDKLSTIFIECSWPSGRQDNVLFGHLNPEHLTAELVALANEVVKYRRVGSSSAQDPRPPRKKQKKSPISSAELRGSLAGLRVYIIHCKDNVDKTIPEPPRLAIIKQVRALVTAQGLGVEILAAEQGMRLEL